MRRLVDKFTAFILLVATSPILLVVAIIIFVLDRHNPIYSQERLGKNEVPFTLFKLRTMRPGTPSVTSHQLNSSALTPIGSLLRKAKLDELPQLVNVLRGDMALVGPRPGLVTHHELTVARRSQGVFEELPGITGLSQLRGITMDQPEHLATSDREYLESRSILVDLRLLVATALGRGAGDALGHTK